MGLFHGGALLGAHGEGLVAGASEPLPGAQLGEDGIHVLERAAHPLQFRVFTTPPCEGGAHVVIGEGRAVAALGGCIQNNGVVLDAGGHELLGDALLHIPRGLANL